MIAEARQGRSKRIVGLFPELLGVGGIQEAGRLTAVALQKIASKWGWSTEFLALNDPRGPQVLSPGEMEIPFQGFCRSKLRFALAAMQIAAGETRMVLAAHPHLAVPGAQMKLLNRDLKMLAISHGIEVWEPLSWFRRIAFQRSDLFLAPSRYTAEKIAQEQSVPRNRIRRLPWPLSPGIIRMIECPGQMLLPPAFPRGLVVVTVARLAASEKYKGVDKLIQAVARLRTDFKNLHLVVVGGGNDLARHVQLAADLRISDGVHFFDNLSREEIAGCYSRCDIFALPSTGEGFGLVFLEAMAFGKPVIGGAAGGIPDIVEDGKNGYLVAAGDLGQLCQALTVLLSNEQLRVELGDKGAELVRAKYGFDGFCAELESILRDSGLESRTR